MNTRGVFMEGGMGEKRKRASTATCGLLAEALLSVRTRGIVAEAWIAKALDNALSTHPWDGGGRPYRRDLGKRIARLVWSDKDKEALAKALAKLTGEERVRETVLKFFRTSGLAMAGIPVDHPDIGREQLMSAMLGRLVYGQPPGYRNELDRQGNYVLLQAAGSGQINRSLLCVYAPDPDGVMWALHLYRSAGDPPARVRCRTGVFLPESPQTALLSGARWIDPAPVIKARFREDAAQALLKALATSSRDAGLHGRDLTIVTFKTKDAAHLIDQDTTRAIGYLPQADQLDAGALEQVGLASRDALAADEAAVAPRLSAEQMMALSDIQMALAQFAAIPEASAQADQIS
jgi:hypothetical protein